MKYIVAIILLTGLSWHCKQEPPPIRPELTKYDSSPKAGLPFFQGKNMDPFWPKTKTQKGNLRKLRNFSLISHEGKTFNQQQLKGKFTVVAFFFATCTGICPMLAHHLKNFTDSHGHEKDIAVVSFSVNPEKDTPKALREFRSRHKIGSKQWTLLTGDRSQIYKIARQDFSADTILKRDKPGIDFLHSENIFLLDKDRYLRAVYRGRGSAGYKQLYQDILTLRKI